MPKQHLNPASLLPIVDRGISSAMGSAPRECFPRDTPPSSPWIGVAALAVPEFLVEIEATAVLG